MELPAEVIAELQGNRKIAAIKLLRAREKIGLKEAKGLVGAYMDAQPSSSTSPRTNESEGGVGRLLFFVLVVGAAYGLYRYFS